MCMHAQLCPTLCNPMYCSPPGSSVHGISQARILEWVAILFSRGPSWPRDQICISCIGRWILYHWATREALRYLNSQAWKGGHGGGEGRWVMPGFSDSIPHGADGSCELKGLRTKSQTSVALQSPHRPLFWQIFPQRRLPMRKLSWLASVGLKCNQVLWDQDVPWLC